MSRVQRLLDLMTVVRSRSGFTAQALADEFGVSRRTMLRDLNVLVVLGVPLESQAGPGGGFRLSRTQRQLILALSGEEALALVVAYEAFVRQSGTFLSEPQQSAVSKIKRSLTPDVQCELERWRGYIAVWPSPLVVDIAYLGDLFRASVDQQTLHVLDESAGSGQCDRTIFPYGVFARDGFWYCACFDYPTCRHVTLRIDRVYRVDVASQGPDLPEAMTLKAWLARYDQLDPRLELRVRVDRSARHDIRLAPLLARASLQIEQEEAWFIETSISADDIEYWATQLAGLGDQVYVEAPDALATALCEKARRLLRRYTVKSSPNTL